MNLTVYIGPDQSANLKELLRRTPLGRGAACAVVPDFRSVAALERLLTEVSG